MEPRIIFDVAMKPFDWQPIKVSAALLIGGLVAILSERFKWGYTAVKNAGYFLIALGLFAASYVSVDWHLSRRERMGALANHRFQLVEGTVAEFVPAYYEGRKEESFTVSNHAFRYSDSKTTPCFNQPWAHGGPIHAGELVRIAFTDTCILRIEALPGAGGPR